MLTFFTNKYFKTGKKWEGPITVTVYREGWSWDQWSFFNPFAAMKMVDELRMEAKVQHVTVYFRFPWQRVAMRVKRYKGFFAKPNRPLLKEYQDLFRED